MTRFPVFGHHFPVLEQPFLFQNIIFLFQNIIFLFQNVLFCSVLFCPVSRPGYWLYRTVPSQIQAVPARPVPQQDFQIVPLSLCPCTMKELLSLCPEKLHCPVQLETLFRPNSITYQKKILFNSNAAKTYIFQVHILRFFYKIFHFSLVQPKRMPTFQFRQINCFFTFVEID